MTISRLQQIEVILLYVNLANKTYWEFHNVVTNYSDPWIGPISQQSTSFSSGEASLSIFVRDLSEPKAPRFPQFTGFWRVWMSIAFFVLLFVALVLYIALRYIIFSNVKINKNLPPPFFGGTQRFRGW